MKTIVKIFSYRFLSKIYMIINKELKRRDAAVGFRSTPKGNYP